MTSIPKCCRDEESLSNKYCHAELDSASTLYTVHRFRNEFGMTLRNELLGQPLSISIFPFSIFNLYVIIFLCLQKFAP